MKGIIDNSQYASYRYYRWIVNFAILSFTFVFTFVRTKYEATTEDKTEKFIIKSVNHLDTIGAEDNSHSKSFNMYRYNSMKGKIPMKLKV